MGIYIPNMDKPKRCMYCIAFTLQEAPTHYAYDEPPYVYPYCELLEREVDDDTIPNDCPLIEIDDELIKKLQESAIVIKAVFNRLKKVVNNSDGLKTELMGTNPNLTIFDEANERRNDVNNTERD